MNWRTETTAYNEILRHDENHGIATGAIPSVLRRLDDELDTRDRRVVFKRGGGMAEAIAFLRAQPDAAHLFRGGKTAPTRADLVRNLNVVNGAADTIDINKHRGIYRSVK